MRTKVAMACLLLLRSLVAIPAASATGYCRDTQSGGMTGSATAAARHQRSSDGGETKAWDSWYRDVVCPNGAHVSVMGFDTGPLV